jgi:gas vesicle protein GvpG
MLFKLLGAPLTLPLAGAKFVFQQIADLADAELNDESTVHEQLLLLQIQLEEGDLTDDEYVEQEAVLMQRLREIKARKREQLDALATETPPEADVTARRRMVIETPFDQD